jgi:hypothetical protein
LPNGLAVTEENVYWIDDSGTLSRDDRLVEQNSENKDFIKTDLNNLSAIHLVQGKKFDDETRKLQIECRSKNCSDICVGKFL